MSLARVNRTAARLAGVLAAAAAIIGLPGCAHSTHARPTPPPPTASSDPAAQQRLEKALLTAPELPLGYEAEAAGDTNAIGCTGIDRIYLAPGATAKAQVSFSHALSRSFLNETLLVWPGDAAAGIDAFGKAATSCRSFRGSANVTYKVTALSLPRFGDASAAVRITAAQRESRPVDLVATLVGDTVIVVANANAGTIDPELTRTVVTRAVAKVRKLGG
jgi:hypothetical protein